MKLRGIILASLLAVGLNSTVSASEENPFGRKSPPRAPEVSQASQGVDTALLAEIVQELGSEDTTFVIEYIEKVYNLRSKYKDVLSKEVELRQSKTSDGSQAELMKQYVQLLQEEKDLAREIINTVTSDLEAHESRLLQVTAKIHRVGDNYMKQTISNITGEVKKFVRYRLINTRDTERAFYMDVMRFLDHYFRS